MNKANQYSIVKTANMFQNIIKRSNNISFIFLEIDLDSEEFIAYITLLRFNNRTNIVGNVIIIHYTYFFNSEYVLREYICTHMIHRVSFVTAVYPQPPSTAFVFYDYYGHSISTMAA